MDVFAHWDNGAYCLLEEAGDKDYRALIEQFGPPDYAKPADWEVIGGIVPSLVEVDITDWKAVRDRVIAIVTWMASPPECPHCGEPHPDCMYPSD